MKIDIPVLVFVVFALIVYCGYDTVTTIMATNHLGTFDYETSFAARVAHDILGVSGFVLIKFIVSVLGVIGCYVIATTIEDMRYIGIGILAGAGMAGFFAGMSNLNIVNNGTSFFIFGISGQIVSIAILILCVCVGAMIPRLILTCERIESDTYI